MKETTHSNTMASKSVWLSLLFITVMALAMLSNPTAAQSTDRLIVTDPTGATTEFAATDGGTIRLNSNTLPSNVPSWALIYGSSNTNSNSGLTMDSYGSSATLGGGFEFRYGRGTQTSPTIVQNGDRLGFFVFYGFDGTNFLGSAGLTAKVDGPVSTGTVPEKLVFETDSAGYPRLERMVISSSGNVGIGGDTGNGIPEPSNPLQMGSGAYVTAGGVWTNASSRAYKENINALTTEEANNTLDGLSPVKYNYKADKADKHVGFIAEDVPDLVATKDRKGLSPMDIVAVLTKVVQEQKDMISDLSKKIEAMQKELDRVKGMNIVGSAAGE